MKTKIYFAILLAGLSFNHTKAQISSTNNFGGSSDYVGWNSGQTFPLNIKHEANLPINFHTNTGAGGLNNMRMQITNTTVTAPDGTNRFVGRVAIRESSVGPITPLALLHLGNPWLFNVGGHRPWMDVGTFTTAGGDNMYVGLKIESDGTDNFPWNDHMDAVINWGDNLAIPDNFNDLRFIFTTETTGLASDLVNGLEMVRISAFGNMGIGNFYNPSTPLNPIRPARRLEVLDGSRNEPQMRLTHTQVGNPNPAYTDFQATSDGDLIINPKNNTINGFVGINTTITNPPTTTLQINANNNNQSGLRLEKLTSGSPTVPTNNKVLTVDNIGNVILADDDNGGGGGGSNTANNGLTLTGSNIQLGGTLIQNTQVALDNYTFKYTGPSFAGQTLRWQIENDGRQKSWCSDLASGTAWDYFVPFASSSLTQTGLNLYSTANTSATNYGLNNQITNSDLRNSEIVAYNATLLNMDNLTEKRYIAYSSAQREYAYDNQAFYGKITPTNRKNENIGLNLEISNAALSIGCDNEVYNSENAFGYRTIVDDIQNKGYGLYADVTAKEYSYGVSAKASGGSSINYAIYGEASPGNCNNTICTNAAGYFEGELFHSGMIYTSSDLKLKKNINDLQNASSILKQLNPKTYEFDLTTYGGMNLQSGLQYGLIAQDVETVLPTFVKQFKSPTKYDSKGIVTYPEVDFKAVDYVSLIPILIATIKEQQQNIDSLFSLLANQVPASNRTSNPSQKVVLKNAQQIILDQNDPNPFSETTTINYSIPKEVKNAKIIFTNSAGVILRSVIINERGEGSLEVYGSNLSSGIYNYTLFIDGKATLTKKMMKQ